MPRASRTPIDASAPLRASIVRWTTLSMLLAALERGVEASARLDARGQYGGRGRPPGLSGPHTIAFDARLRVLENRVGHELDRLTVEHLALDLFRKQRAMAAAS